MITKIRDLSHDGRGVGTINGKTVFVENAYLGEVVGVEIIKEKKNYLEGRTKKIIEKSINRIDSICDDFYHCNGCQYCDYKYQAQLESKIDRVKSNLKKFSGIQVEDIQIYGMEDFFTIETMSS